MLELSNITSSNAHKLLHTNRNDPAKSVILGITQPSYPISTPAILWGKSNEKNARETYEKHLQLKHHICVSLVIMSKLVACELI